MTNFEITVHVNLGVTAELSALVSAFMHKEMQPVEAVSLESTTAEDGKPARRSRKAKAEQPANEPAPIEDSAPEQTPESEVEPEPNDEKKELTEEDVRAAMHNTRIRIEGEDYKENTDGEKYKKYHKQLTANFKNISSLLGADKPSALAADKRESFISQCNELIIDDDGTIQTKCPY